MGRQRIGIVERQKRRLVIPFLLPVLAVFGFFMLYPAASTFYVAVLDWDGVRAPKFVGLDNFTELAGDELFRSTIGNTVWFTVLGALLLFPLALFFAAVTRKARGGKAYRFFILAPVALSVATAALLWKFMLNPGFGFIPEALRAVGLDGLASFEPLASTWAAMIVVVVATVWHGVGIWTLLFAAALERVPVELREAATLDGASGWQTFRYVVFPLIWDVTRTLLILWMIQGLQTFAFIIAITNGGPLKSTEVMATYLYNTAFTTEGRFGYAAAIAVVLFIVILGLTLGANRLTRRESEQY